MIRKAFLLAVTISLASLAAHATTTTVPDSALLSSPGVYTAGGYFTDSLGNVVLTTGGGNANGVGNLTGRNDDGFSGPIVLPFTVNLFGNSYTQFWINNNGNVSFNNGISSFTPSGPTGANVPIISPFFADVDTRNASSGVVMYNATLNGGNTVAVTWDGVGFYNEHGSPLDYFQLILNNPAAVPAGQGDIGFFYETVGWETGDASGGSGGFGGTPAAVGFGDGAGNGEVLQGSIQNGISGIVNNHYIWFDTNCPAGTTGAGCNPIPITGTPEPSTLVLFGSGLLALGGAIRRRLSL